MRTPVWFMWVSSALALAAASVAGGEEGKMEPSADVVIADFEGDDWAGWHSEGEAFDSRPAQGRYEVWNQPRPSGFLGRGFANSFYNNQYSKGTLTSPEFRIERSFINFLLAGIKHPTDLCVALVVEGRDVRRATPSNTNTLECATLDLAELKGRTARIEIRDRHFNGWIIVDEIVQSDRAKAEEAQGEPTPWNPADYATTIDAAQLHLPVHPDAPLQEVSIEIGGERVLAFDMQVAVDEVAGYVPVYELSQHRNEQLVVRFHEHPGSRTRELIRLSDAAPPIPDDGERPAFHPHCRIGALNDPNGLVYYDGEYHLFHQYALFSMRGKHWAHWVSDDLVHWRELPIALFPDYLGSMHSGSAAVDKKNTAGFQTGEEKTIVAAFTGSQGLGGSRKIQVQGLAWSNDRGRTFTKYAGNPVIGVERRDIMKTDQNRDPKIFWYDRGQHWVMVLFERKGLSIFTSPNLKDWTFQSHDEGFHECPELFELALDGDPGRTRWVMFGGSGQYALGSFDGKRFQPDSPGEKHRMHHGNAFYASQTFNNVPEKDGRRILVAWMRSQISFPVELALRTTPEGPRVFANPVGEVERLRARRREFDPMALKSGRHALEGAEGDLLDIEAEFSIGSAEALGLTVRETPVRYDAKQELLVCGDRTAPLSPENGRVRLRLIVDRRSIEIFGGDGRIYMPMFLNLDGKDASVELFAEGGEGRVEALRVDYLKSAWE